MIMLNPSHCDIPEQLEILLNNIPASFQTKHKNTKHTKHSRKTKTQSSKLRHNKWHIFQTVSVGMILTVLPLIRAAPTVFHTLNSLTYPIPDSDVVT